ncbi:MAG: type IX secretion system membrane protein PorP/SprF [Chitinophagaceae bacterium]|nr:MAG: type IX secretion system membrane protein PorP/SprF [Chitinophagaceae bacterium]
MKKIFFLLFTCITLFHVKAQDIHYSQFYNSPLTLNPALTGKTDGSFRVNVNYRNQWFGISSEGATYETPSISFEKPIRVGKNDVFGLGVVLVNDQSSAGRLTNFSAMLSTAYHKSLDQNGRHVISLGLQGGYAQKRLDFANLKFASQFENIGGWQHNPGLPSLENIPETNVGNFDMQAGLLWTSRIGSNVLAYAGFSMFHVLEPEQNFTDGSTLKLPRRNVVHAGADFALSDRFSLLPSVIYMQQAKVDQLNAGLAAAIDFNEESALYLGAYYRIDDAVIPYAAFELRGFKLGLSYDVTVSELNQTNGSIELSLSYTGRYTPMPEAKPSLFAPRF